MRTLRLLVFVTVVLAAIGAVSRVSAWNDTGHMLAAELAYRQLGLAERARAVQILKDAFVSGPDGLAWFRRDLTEGLRQGSSAADRDHFIFLKAATWPDILRDESHPLHQEFHKAKWHYINLPYTPSGEDAAVPDSPAHSTGNANPKEIVAAIKLCAADVKAPSTSKRIRAARLCFLLHMVGDIHQPLHAADMISADGLPHGDQGGNLQLVRIPGDEDEHDRVVTLHSVWDGLFGHDTRLSTLRDLGERILHDPKTRPDSLGALLARKDPMEWARESLDDAIDVAYREGSLKTLRGMSLDKFRKQHAIQGKDVPRLPRNYERKSHPVADKRIALAGCRLAEILTEALAPAP